MMAKFDQSLIDPLVERSSSTQAYSSTAQPHDRSLKAS